MDEKKNKKSRKLLIVLLIILSVALIAFIIISPYVAAKAHYENEAKKKVDAAGELVFTEAESSIVYDKNNEEIAIFESDIDKYYMYSSDMTEEFKNAFVMLVDRDFYEKEGADWQTLLKIARDDRKAQKQVEGVSVITRVIARDMFLSYDLEKDNSLMEVFVANELEARYSKDEILEFYVNNLYFNNGFYGVGAAARGYFGKNPTELTISETAFLAAIAEDPQLSPYTDKESLLVKRNVIITRLHDDEIIDEAQYFSAISQTIKLEGSLPVINNYVETYVINCVVRALMEQDGFVFRTSFDDGDQRVSYEKEYEKSYLNHYESLYKKGYRIYTSFDMELQDKLQAVVDSSLAFNTTITPEGGPALQGSAVCLDNETGRVVAIVGGRSVNSNEYEYNRAFEDYTTAGKIITPLNVYTPFIEWHHNPDYIVYREEAVDGTFINQVTLKEAILTYSDDFATKVYARLTPSYALTVLDRIGFKKALSAPATNDGHGSVMTNTLELATGYGVIARDGVYTPATCVVRITDNRGQDVYTNTSSSVNAYAANDARIMSEILAQNISEGFLKNYKTDNAITAAMASDAGTYEGFFAGYSTYYTVAAYAGFEGLTVQEIVAQNTDTVAIAGQIWKNFMEEIHKDKELKEFPESGPYSDEPEAEEEILQPTTEQPSLGGIGGHPGDGDDYIR